MNVGTTSRALAALVLTLMAAAPLQPARARGDDTPPGTAAAPAPASASPVSATGLLPIFGVGIDLDAVSSSASPDDAVASVQKLWDRYMKEAGFNVIQFPVDVRELGDKGAGRLAKLCAWAKANDVRLAPLLIGAAAGDPLPGDYPDRVGSFAAKTIELTGKGGDAQAYSQIMFYQLGGPLNHPANHGPMEASQAAELLGKTIEKLHAAEQAALAGTSLQATPVLASASFDYELIRFGAIVNVPLTDESYQQAYESLRGYLTAVLGTAAIDVVGLEWFPGSVSSDAADKVPDLVTRLQGDFPGKLLLIATGYSTATGSESDQSRYYTQTFNNLSDLRANQGVESSFAGILWRTAMDRPGGEPDPPSSKTLGELPKWNWTERAGEITRMWNTPGADSKEMRWWLGRVESHFGLLGAGKDISKPGEPKLSYKLLSRLKTSLAAAAVATGAGDIANELTSGGGAKGVAGTVKQKLQSALFGMLDAWIAKTAQNLVSGGGPGDGDSGDGYGEGGGGGAPAPAPANLADLRIEGVQAVEEITAGTLTPLSITVVNNGSAAATNVVLYLRENSSTDLANSTPTVLSPSGSTTITVPWTPGHAGNYQSVALDAYCDNEGDPSTNHVDFGDVTVSAAPSGGGGGGRGGVIGGLHIDPDRLGAIKGSLQTKTDPGFLQIHAVRSMPAVPMMAMSLGGGGDGGAPQVLRQSGGSGVTVIGRGSTGGTASVSQAMTAAPSGPQPISLAFSVANPFDHNFTEVHGTLKIENKVIATKDLGVLFPRQRRTVTFAQWTPTKSGNFPVRIELAGKGPGGRPLSATAVDQIMVSAAAMRPGGAPASGGSGGASTRSVLVGKGTGGTAGAPMSAGGGVMSMTKTRLLAPLIIASAPGLSAGPQTRPLYLTRGGAKSFAMTASLLGVTANSIVLTPYPAPVGADVELSVRLFNSERLPANKVKLEAFIDDDRLGETTVDVPVARPVLAKGLRAWKAKPGRHSARVVVTWGGRSGSAEKPIDIRSPDTIGKGGVASLIGRASFSFPRLTITAADVRLNPVAPSAGEAVELSVRAQNTGSADAKGVRVELYADGVRLGEATGDIGAGKDRVFTGFPRWTPAAGKHVLLCRATVAGQTTEATREITAAAMATLLVKPVRAPGATLVTPEIKTGGLMMMTVLERPDLQILPTDITYSPATPKAGDPLNITIVVRNIGTGAANGGAVVGVFQVDGKEAARREFPVTIGPNGMTTLVWPVTTPSGSALTAVATARVANDSRADNNEARASTSVMTLLMKMPKEPGPFILQPR